MDATTWSPGRKVAAVAIPALAVVAAILTLTAPEPVPTPAPVPSDVAPAAAAPETETETEPQPAPAPAATPAEPPAFDLVRVEPDGQAVVAGTAAPGAEVTVYAGATPLAETTADAAGNFVAIFAAPPSATPQTLTLGASTAGGATVPSGDAVVLLPQATPLDLGGGPAPVPEVAATAIVRADGIEVQPTAPALPAEARDVSLGSIAYAEAGTVTLAGIGTAGSILRAYVDGALAHEARVGEDGRWRMDLGDVAEGLYTLRIDQIAPDGRVESRVETPFQRDYPRAPLPRPGTDPGAAAGEAGVLTVQPGQNLWTIARLHYGSGVLYAQIFTANTALIRDPNLIYPGQVLDLPDVARAPAPGVTGPKPRE